MFTASCQLFLCCKVLLYAVQCRAVPCCAVPYRAVPCRTVPCRAVPCRTVPFRAVPYRTVPCRTVPNRVVPYRTGPFYTVPCIRYHIVYYGYYGYQLIWCLFIITMLCSTVRSSMAWHAKAKISELSEMFLVVIASAGTASFCIV